MPGLWRSADPDASALRYVRAELFMMVVFAVSDGGRVQTQTVFVRLVENTTDQLLIDQRRVVERIGNGRGRGFAPFDHEDEPVDRTGDRLGIDHGGQRRQIYDDVVVGLAG